MRSWLFILIFIITSVSGCEMDLGNEYTPRGKVTFWKNSAPSSCPQLIIYIDGENTSDRIKCATIEPTCPDYSFTVERLSSGEHTAQLRYGSVPVGPTVTFIIKDGDCITVQL